MRAWEIAGVAATIAAVFALQRLSSWRASHKAQRDALAHLPRTWGQDLRHPRDGRAVDALDPPDAPPGCDRLDAQTWTDLDMPRVFARIDRTLTSIGAQTLHVMLRCPCIDAETLARRRALVDAVAEDSEARVAMQRALLRLGDGWGWQAIDALQRPLPTLPGPRWLARAAPLVTAGLLLSGWALQQLLLFAPGLLLALALPFVHTLASRRIGAHLEAVVDLRRVLATADALQAVMPATVRTLLGDPLASIASLRHSFGDIASPSPGTAGELTALAGEYGNAFLLTELTAYQRATSEITHNRDALRAVLDAVGTVDAAIGIAELRAHDPSLCEPSLDPEATALVAADVRHPLVADAMGNDVQLGPKGLLITGSNMAGKSTLLRAIAVDAVLAQSIGLVAATSWSAPLLRVRTAMGAHDDLAAGTSLFRAEVDRIHTLVDSCDGRHLFVLDEPFRGTNPHERVAASAAVLGHLCATDLVIAATHDRELCAHLDDRFTLGYFSEQVDGDDLVFDYRLRPGVLQTPNAIALLERAGYPPALVAEARTLAGQ
jgi:hypothetical protein